MKKQFLLLFFAGFLAQSCTKNCSFSNAKCSEQPPTDQTCQAYFESWIYNSQTKKCEWKGYSGCSAIGFESREECEECKCK
jgi:hypothetical protein